MLCFFLRRGRDSNSRYPLGVYTLSRRTSSTTRAPLRIFWKHKCIKRNRDMKIKGVKEIGGMQEI